jgi:hypothetical protein
VNPSAKKASELFRSANPVPGAAYEDAALGPRAAATLSRITESPHPRSTTADITRRRRRAPYVIGMAVAATAAAIVVPLMVTGGTMPANAVTRNRDGSVAIRLRFPSEDMDGFHRKLTAAGVPNRIVVSQSTCPPGSRTGSSFIPETGDIMKPVIKDGDERYIIYPKKMPPHTMVVFLIWRSASRPDISAREEFGVMRHVPTCLVDSKIHIPGT